MCVRYHVAHFLVAKAVLAELDSCLVPATILRSGCKYPSGAIIEVTESHGYLCEEFLKSYDAVWSPEC